MNFNKTMRMGFAVAAAVFAAVSVAPAVQNFEGMMQFKISGHKNPEMVDYYIKDNKVRIERLDKSAKEGVVIMDNKTKTMTVLMPEQKKFMEMDMNKTAARAKAYEKKKPEGEPNFSKTGKTETILGYACEQWISKGEDGNTSEIWAAKNIGTFGGFGRRENKPESPWEKKISEEGLFPLKVIGLDESGKEKSRWEVTKIDKKSLSSDMFQPPSGYEKMEMPAMPDMKGDMKKGMSEEMKNKLKGMYKPY